jgi:DNA repair protein RecN (Recombination protein N)
MLSYLRIRGLALADDIELELQPGLNVLTGETGAGKSIIVGALALLRGARARAELVREGDEAAIVDAQFDPPSEVVSALAAVLEEAGVPTTLDEGLLARRIVPRTGRGRAFLQATLTTQNTLSRAGELLLDICSQHEFHFLTDEQRHLDVLDSWAALHTLVTEHHRRFRAWRTAADRLGELTGRASHRLQQADFLRFQIEEIERVDPQPGEHDELRRRVGILRHLERWAAFAREAQDSLYESDDAIAGRLSALLERARGGTEESAELAEIEEQLQAAQVACEEAARMAERFSRALDVDPEELQRVEDRLDELDMLRRKHGVEPEALIERLVQMRLELEELDNAEEHLHAARMLVERHEQEARLSAEGLHERRVAAAAGLARAIEGELRALHLQHARIEVAIERDDAEPGARGFDRVRFLFSANPGEAMAPLSRVASGGELSRVMLAIKGALTAGDQIATYVFDEVDAGVGGEVAEAIGRRLRAAASGHQVLCVTHLPQIAAFASAHYRVEKNTKGGRTRTSVVTLDEDARVDELARMLGGAKDSAREHARRMLRDAQRPPRGRASARRASRARA